MNKKSEGTASTFLIASLIAITILVSIGTMVNQFSSTYGQSDIDYFEGYTSIQGNISTVSGQYVSDYDFNQNNTKPDVDRTEDFLFYKAFRIIKRTPKILSSVGTGINKAGADLGIPLSYRVLLYTILGIESLPAGLPLKCFT